jgi:hypothetical protein
MNVVLPAAKIPFAHYNKVVGSNARKEYMLMKAVKIKHVVVFGLLLLCLGCSPVLTNPGGPGNSVPTAKLTTPIFATPQVGKETLNPLENKPTQARAAEYPMYSGGTLALKGGLTDEARSILQSGKTGYFLLSFANPTDPTLLQSLKDAGIKRLQMGWLYAEVPPSALQTLDTWSKDGKLVFGGSIPSDGKIEALLKVAASTSPDEIIQVSVILFTKPDEVTKKQVEKLFDEVHWPETMPENGTPLDGKIRGRNIEALSKISIVLSIQKAAVPSLP